MPTTAVTPMTIATAGGAMLMEGESCPEEGPGSDTVLIDTYALCTYERLNDREDSKCGDKATKWLADPCTSRPVHDVPIVAKPGSIRPINSKQT